MLAGRLEIEIAAGIARLQSDMNQAQRVVGSSMKNIESAVASAKSVLDALGIGLGVGYFTSLVKDAIDAAGKINDLSQSMGVAVQELGKYKLATEQSGTSLEGLAKGVKGVAVALVENRDGLRAAGITATTADGAMRQLADLFSKMPDGLEKTTLATKLFGKSGMELIPMLNMGAAGLDEAAEKSAKYAAVLATLAPQADKFNNTLAELGMASKVASLSIINDALPAMTKIAAAMALAAHESGALKAAWVGFGGIAWEGVFKPLSGLIMGATASLMELNAEMLKFFGANKGAAYEFERAARMWGKVAALDSPQSASPAAKPFDTEAWTAQYKKMMKALGLEDDKANKERLAMLEKYRKMDADGWLKYIDALTAEYEDGLKEQAKLDEAFYKRKEELRLGDLKAVFDIIDAEQDAAVEMGAILAQDITEHHKGLEEIKKASKEMNDDLKRGLTDSIFRGFEAGKGFGQNFWDSMVNMAKTTVLRPAIEFLVSPVTGAVTAALGGLVIPGMANAAGGGSLLSGGASLLQMLGGGIGGSFGAGLTFAGSPGVGIMGGLAEAFTGGGSLGFGLGAALPAVGLGLGALGLLGAFGGGGGGGPAVGYGTGVQGAVSRGGFSGQLYGLSQNSDTKYRDPYLVPGGPAYLQDAMSQAASDTFEKMAALAQKMGVSADALSSASFPVNFEVGAGSMSEDPAVRTAAMVEALNAAMASMTDQMAEALIPNIRQLAKENETLTQTFVRLADEQEVLNTQRRGMEIMLMEAQGDVAGALAAKRADELAAMDKTLRPLQEIINKTLDWNEALNAAKSATQNAVDAQISASRSASQAARSAADSFRQIGISLSDAVTRIRGGGRTGAGNLLDAMFSRASTGDAAALAGLPKAVDDFLAASRASSVTSLDFARDQAKAIDILTKAGIVSEAMVNWNEYQATLLETQTGILEAIKLQLSLPSPDAAILTQQMGMLGTIDALLRNQTTQIVSGSGMQAVLMHDQTGKIILANALTVDQTGKITLGNSLVGTQTSQIITGNAIQDAIANIAALDTRYSEEMLRALVTGATTQTDSLQGILNANDLTVSLLQQLVSMTAQSQAERAAAAAAEQAAAAGRALQQQISVATAAYQGQKAISDSMLAQYQQYAGMPGFAPNPAWTAQEDIAAGRPYVWGGSYTNIPESQLQQLFLFRDQYAEAFGRTADLWRAIPGHASGLSYVPYDNYLMRAHEGERVLTKSEASGWRGGSNDELIAEIQALRIEVSELKSEARKTEGNTRKTANINEAVANGQLSYSTVAA